MHRTYRWLLLGPCFLFATIASAQDSLEVTNEYFLSKISESNWQVILSQKEAAAAQAGVKQTNAVFLPQVGLSYTAMTTTNPLMAFGSKLNQSILTSADFNPDLLNDPERTDNFATEIEVLQPLINVDGFYQRSAAKQKTEAMKLKAERTFEGIQLETKKAYMQLQLAYEAVNVLERAKDAAEASVKMAQDFFDVGFIQKPDLLEAQVYLADVENKMEKAQSQLIYCSDYLKFLVRDTLDVIYVPNEPLTFEDAELDYNPTMSTSRADIQAMNLSAEAMKNMHQASKSSFLPRVNAFGRYQMYDDEIFQADATGYLVGVQLSWKLFNGYQSLGQNEKSRLQYEVAKTEADQYVSTSQLEFEQQVRNLAVARGNVANQELAVQQYREAYSIRKDRYEEGLEKTSDLLITEAQLFQKEMAYLQAVFEYQLTREYINFLTE